MSRKPAKKATKAKAPAKNKGGRPSKYSPALLETIRLRLSKGEPLAAICRGEGMPDDDTVRNWMEHKVHGSEVSRVLARARDAGREWLLAECKQIADTPMLGVTEKLEWVVIADPDDAEAPATRELQVTERKVEDMLGHRKFQVDTRLKLLAVWDPKKYGARQTIEHDVSDNLAEKLKAARERAGTR